MDTTLIARRTDGPVRSGERDLFTVEASDLGIPPETVRYPDTIVLSDGPDDPFPMTFWLIVASSPCRPDLHETERCRLGRHADRDGYLIATDYRTPLRTSFLRVFND